MAYLGSWKIDDNLTFACNTHTAATGAGTDADSVPTYRVYEDETGTPILTGSTALLDSANTVGFYSEQIALSAANGFEKGKCYTIYITATVATIAGTTHHTFQIEAEVDVSTDAVDAILDDVVEGTLTVRQMLRLFQAVLAGKSTGGGTTTVNFRNNADTLNRVVATVDANGNRSAVTLDAT